MASKDAFYLKHDFNASRDPKIVKLLRAHGWGGYGLYWAMVERIYEQGGRIAADFDALAYDLRSESSLIEAIVSGFDLFTVAEGKIGSPSIDRRLDERRAASMAASAAAVGRWNAEAMRPHSGPNARRGEERRGKDITAASGSPSAADLSKKIDKTIEAQANALFMARMEDARLPFDYGDFKKGGRINDLPAETCALVLETVPRLGLDLRRFLQIKIDEKKADGNRRKS